MEIEAAPPDGGGPVSGTAGVGVGLHQYVHYADVDADGLELERVELFRGYPALLPQVAAACCALFSLVGVPGNLITIIALNRCKKVRNATAVFIMNLALSDLLSGMLTLPLAASTFWRRHWTHGSLLCRLFPLLRYGLLAVSLFTVLGITINRYVMIGHPSLYPRLYRGYSLCLMVGSTWVCGFCALLATWLEKWGRFGLDPYISSCSILPDSSGHSPKVFLFAFAFVIPCIAIAGCYARIFHIVRQTALKSHGAPAQPSVKARPGKPSATSSTSAPSAASTSTERASPGAPPPTAAVLADRLAERRHSVSSAGSVPPAPPPGSPGLAKRLPAAVTSVLRRTSQQDRMTPKDRKLLKMILVIFISFVICYLPITVSKTFRDIFEHRLLNIAGYVCIYFTTCINPIVYVVMSSEYRQAYKNLLMCRSNEAA